MESVASFLCFHAPYAHFVLFGLILLSGWNIPVPEDILCMIGGVIVSTCVPDHYWLMFVWLYSGAILSAYEAYWLGRVLGPRLYDMHYFQHVITRKRVMKIGRLLERFGVFTFLIGRFIPFGVRNGIFMTSGLTKMPFPRFMWRDAVGAFVATFVLFYLGNQFGEHFPLLLHYFHTYEMAALVVIATAVIAIAALYWLTSRVFGNNSSS